MQNSEGVDLKEELFCNSQGDEQISEIVDMIMAFGSGPRMAAVAMGMLETNVGWTWCLQL